MSFDTCRCGKFVDTDEDGNAYFVEAEDGSTIDLSYALCPSCRDDFQGLLELKEKVEQFTQDVFDWVRCVGDVGMLDHLYQFKTLIEKKTDPHNAKGEN